MEETVNPYSSPTAVDQPPPPDCDSFYGTISRTFAISRRYKFFIGPGELLAGALPGESRQQIARRSKAFLLIAAVMAMTMTGYVMLEGWETAIIAIAVGVIVTIVGVAEGPTWLRTPGDNTPYDFVDPTLATFQDLNRHSFLIRASDVTTMKLVRGLKVVRDALELTLEPASGRPQRFRIELEGTIDKLGIERALYEAGFPTMPTQWGAECE